MSKQVFASNLKEGDIILEWANELHVREVQCAQFDQIKVRADHGDPNSMPGTYFFDFDEKLYIKN